MHAKKDAVKYIQYEALRQLAGSGLTHIKCMLGKFKHCENYSRPQAEEKFERAELKIFSYLWEETYIQ